MKVTLEITDELFEDAMRVAADLEITIDALFEVALRREVADRKSAAQPTKLRDESFRGNGWHPDMRGMDRTRLREMAYVD
jgi:hypothetical protein